jgi:DNA primase
MIANFERADLVGAGILRDGSDSIEWPDYPLCIPWSDRFGRIQCVQRRRLDDGKPKYRSPRGRSPRAPFNIEFLSSALEHIGHEAPVVVTEGALDALARRKIARVEREQCAVVGIYSASTAGSGLPTDLLRGRRIILALDNDKAGEDACKTVMAALRGVALGFERETPLGEKDWGDALCAAMGGVAK